MNSTGGKISLVFGLDFIVSMILVWCRKTPQRIAWQRAAERQARRQTSEQYLWISVYIELRPRAFIS